MEETKITRGRGGKNNTPNVQPLDLEPGDNTKYLRHALATKNMPPIDISDVNQVNERLEWYFRHCAEDDMKPTVTGFCNSLGISRVTLINWKNGIYRSDSHQAVILKAYGLLEELWEHYMQNGKMNPVSAIFLAKNNFGYKDQQDVVVTPNTKDVEAVDATTIEAKYAELPGE